LQEMIDLYTVSFISYSVHSDFNYSVARYLVTLLRYIRVPWVVTY